MDHNVKREALRLMTHSRDIIVCSIDEEGFPNAKAMFYCKHDAAAGWKFWFSTNTSALRTAQFARSPKACLYFVDHEGGHGLMLVGEMRVCMDADSRRLLWKPTDVKYYPQGVDDPDYAVLMFTPAYGNYYHGLTKCRFDIGELA